MTNLTLTSPVGTVTLPDDPNATTVYAEVIEKDCYGLRDLHVAGFRPGMIWDLGASWGMASVLMSHLWPEATVWALEPNPERHRFAVDNLKPLPNARAVQAGLIGYLGRDTKATAEGIAFDGFWRKSPQQLLAEPEAKKALSIAEFIKTASPSPLPVDLLKIDIEGCEIGVLREMQELGLLDTVQHIRGEWHMNALHEIPRILADTHHVSMTLPLCPNPWQQFTAVRREAPHAAV